MSRVLALFVSALLLMPCAVFAQQKVLRYSFTAAETGFDPVAVTDLYSRSVTANIFDAPMRYKWLTKENIEPNTLEAEPEVSSDFKTFTFHLKKGIYFADDAAFNGAKRELVAEDYVYSLKRVYDPHWQSLSYGSLASYKIASLERLRDDATKSGHFDYDTPVEGIRALDRYTWQVKLPNPSPRFVEGIYCDPSIFGVVAREVVEKYGDSIAEHPVGTGPYMLADWVRSSKIVLVKNPNYRTDIFDAHPAADDPEGQATAKRFNGKQMPFIDRVEVTIIEESQPRWLSFLNAEQDLSWPVPPDLVPLGFPNNKLAPNLARKHLQAWRIAEMQYMFYMFNMENPLVGGYTPEKVALRRAIGLGLDAPSLISNVYKYQGAPATSVIVPGQYGFDAQQQSEMGEYDPARANAILDSYGYLPRHGGRWRDLPDGTPFAIEYGTNPAQLYRSIDEIIKKSMDQLGIRLNIKTQQWPELLKQAQSGSFVTWMLGESAASADPNESFQSAYGPAKGGQNMSRFDLPEFNQLFDQQSALPNGPERLALLEKMKKLMAAYMPYKYLFDTDRVYMAYPWLIGWHRDPLLQDWWRYVDIDPVAQAPFLNKN